MSDINANIGVNFDTAQALAELKNLQRQISTFHTSISRSSESAAIAQKNYQTNLLNAINATGQFVAQMGVIKTSTETFTHALENNKLSMREYYRYAGGATKTFGRLFTNEFNTIAKVAEERVKRLQTQYIKMGRDTTGAMRAMAVMPANLDMSNQSTKLQIAAQKQAIFNQLLKQGSTQLLNFGKNTQWAGRQLMVGFTVPLMAFGSSAVRAFQDIETAVIKFRKVYGDLGTTQQQTDAALNQIKDLAQAYTQYGVAVKDTIGLASDAAAAGYQNADLIAQTTSATKLSVLGQIDNQQALKTTISLQSAFNISAKELSGTIDFLNAVENQTVVSLDDLTAAIPIASPVMKQLGGTVKDLAFFLTAMKEGGVSATQGANALKSGLASLINPTKKASDLLATVGINIGEIVTKNKGDLKNTVLDFAKALDTLDPLSRARAIEVMFGKFQFARMSTLFQNITKDGSQASRVLGLMGMSAQDLASITNKELGVQGASALTKFKGAIEKLKATLAPVGELFMKIFTPIMDTISKLLDKFNHLSDGVKKTIGVIVAVVGGLGPIALMTFGLLSNAFANAVKFIATLRTGYQHLTGRSKDLGQQTNYLTTEQMDAAAAAHSLDQSHAKLTQTFTAEANAVSRLRGEYARALLAANEFALANPGMMMPGSRKKFATGGVVRGPGTGTSDSIPAMVSNGESIIPAKQTKKYGSLINAIINNQVPGFATGKPSITGGQSVLLSGLGFMAPGNVASGFGMSRSFFSQGSGFIDSMLASLAGGAFTLGKAGGSESRKLTANVMDAYEKELQQYAEQIVATLRQTAVNMGGVENSSLTLSKVVEASKNDLAPIFNRMKQSGNKAALAAEAVEKHGFFPTVAEMGGVMGETRAGSVREGEKASDVSMRRISTGKSKFQNAVMKFWNRSAAKYEELANQTVTYAHANEQRLLGPVLPFTGRGMAPGVLDSAEQQRLMGLVNLKGSAAAQAYSSTELRSAVRLKGQKDAAAYEASVQQNTQDIYMASRDRKSPHPQAAKDGVDDANAYNSAVAREAKKRRYASSPGGTVGPGGVIITGNMAGETPAQGRKLSMSLEGLNRAVMGTTFGLSALGSLGSMVGGVLGTLSAQVAKYSGLLFALMTVTQLVTQTKMAELVAERVSVASNAMRAVNIASFASKGTGVAGIGARLAQVGFGISKFLGPIGWGITAMTALVGVIKLVNAAKERERQAIEGLGKAANISAGQIAKLGQAFGVTPFKGSAETAKGYIPLNKEQRSLVTQARDALSGDKAYQQDVAALKGASTSQAKMMLQARSTKLLGAGFAKDQVQAIINAMLEDAGKQKIKFVVDSIDVTTKDGQAGIAKTAQTLINDYKKAFAKGYSKTTVNYDSYGQKGSTTYETLSKDLKTKLATAGQEYSSFFIGLQDQFQSGQIKAKDFTTSMQALLSSMSGLSSEQSGKLFTEILKGLNTEWPKAVGTVGTLSDQLLILQGAVSGLDTNQLKTLADALRVLEDPKSAADAIAKAKATIEGIKGQMGKNVSDQSVANNTNGTKTLDLGGTTTKSPYQTAVDQIKANTAALVNQVKAYNILRKAKMDEKTASDMAADSSIAEAFANAKNAKELSAVLALVKKYNAERIKAAGKGISTESGNIQQQLSAYAKLKAAGVDAAGAADLIQNADYSQYINSLKKGSAEWKSAVADAKKLLDLKNQLAHPDMGAGAVAIQTQIDSMLQKFQDQKSAADAYFAAQEQAVNQKYASSLGTPGIKGADQIAVDAAQSQVDAVQKLISAKQYEINIAQHAIDLKQHDIDMNNQLIDQYNQQIDALQHQSDIQYGKPLAALQSESDILSNNLALIDHQAQAINDQYDKQVAALDLVNKANQEAIDLGKQRISIADALSSGDIAAAAQAVQDLRAKQAAAQGNATMSALDAARQNALAGLTAGGMTKAQIEERQFQIQQQSFALQQQQKAIEDQIAAIREQKIYPLEQANLQIQNQIVAAKNALYPLEQQLWDMENNQLKAAQDKLDAANAQLKKDEEMKQAELDAITAQRDKWNDLQIQIDVAKAKQMGLNGSITSAITLVQQLAAAYAALGMAMGTGITTTTTTSTAPAGSGVTGTAAGQAVISAAQAAAQAAGVNSMAADSIAAGAISTLTQMNGGALLSGAQVVNARKSILGYLANGGFAKGTDTVPAMLTPGEFVMNRAASMAYKPLLEAMNGQTYPNMDKMFTNGGHRSSSLSNIVTDNSQVAYNYNLSVNMQGNSVDPHDVAYAVLTKIRQLESGRVKGQTRY